MTTVRWLGVVTWPTCQLASWEITQNLHMEESGGDWVPSWGQNQGVSWRRAGDQLWRKGKGGFMD